MYDLRSGNYFAALPGEHATLLRWCHRSSRQQRAQELPATTIVPPVKDLASTQCRTCEACGALGVVLVPVLLVCAGLCPASDVNTTRRAPWRVSASH